MDSTTQILLIVMLLVLGSTLTIIGVQIFFILREVRESMEKVNLLLGDSRAFTSQLRDSAQDLRRAVNSPWATIGSLAGLVRSFMSRGGRDE